MTQYRQLKPSLSYRTSPNTTAFKKGKTHMDNLFHEIFRVSNAQAQDLAESLLTRNGYTTVRDDRFVYGEGNIPLLLVAHTDTVHHNPPAAIYHDKTAGVLWSPQGLGADDRAGIYLIARILAAGWRPHVLLTDEEESGGGGAIDASELLEAPAVKVMIQLDRMHADDAVYYSCSNGKLRKWVKRFGWKESQGSFTDISILMPAWGIAGVNLSVGYYAQHTYGEHIKVAELEQTFQRVCSMLNDPPTKKLRYHRKQERAMDNLMGWPELTPLFHARTLFCGSNLFRACAKCDRDCDCESDVPDPSSAEYCDRCKRDCLCLWQHVR